MAQASSKQILDCYRVDQLIVRPNFLNSEKFDPSLHILLGE